MTDATYSLKDLVTLTAAAENLPLSERQARQYIADGLIAAPRAKGGGMAYSDEHLLQLRLVLRLASQYVHPRDIEKFVGRLSLDSVRFLVDRPLLARLPSEGDATAYLTRLSRSLAQSHSPFGPSRDAPPIAPRSGSAGGRGTVPHATSSAKHSVADTAKPAAERSAWLKVAVDPDVELHVRVQSGTDSKRTVDALVSALQVVLAGERGLDV